MGLPEIMARARITATNFMFVSDLHKTNAEQLRADAMYLKNICVKNIKNFSEVEVELPDRSSNVFCKECFETADIYICDWIVVKCCYWSLCDDD